MTVIINGSNTPTAGAVAVGDGTTINFTAAGTAGQILQAFIYAASTVLLAILALFFGFYASKLIFS